MIEPIPFAGMVEIDESFDRTASHMASEYVSYNEPVAWMNVHDNYKILFDDELPNAYPNVWIPLYVHPKDKAQ